MLVKRLAQDLDFPLAIDITPTVRELDGLALSSRNTYLSPDERRAALALSRALRTLEQTWRGGEADPARVQRAGLEAMRVPDVTPEYCALVDENLQPVSPVTAHTCAPRAAPDGEPDRGVLDAIRYHTIGFAGWDAVGKMLYLADFLEPARKPTAATADHPQLAQRVPKERAAVLREVARRRIEWMLRS